MNNTIETPKKKSLVLLYVMAVGYTILGINHFVNPGFYEPIMPPYVPMHLMMIYISGAAEILCGILLLPKATRRSAAWGLVLLLIAIFPANIQMAINDAKRNDPDLWIALVRLPLQLPLIWAAWRYTK